MPYSGGLRRSLIPYATGATNWGHGYNPVHEVYGSDSLRLEPYPVRQGEVVRPQDAVPEVLLDPSLWGYTLEDSRVTGVDYDGRPSWNEQPEQYRGDTDNHPAYNVPGFVREAFRGQKGGAHRYDQKLADSLPNETVSEGWENKVQGTVANSVPSDPSQYEIQTSMRQRYEVRNNDHAVDRMTDEPRSRIESRVAGQIVKVYSGGMRHYDMFPKQQTPIVRPFSFRTAGTGPVRYLESNAYNPVEPIQRVPPPDPDMGTPESQLTEEYGYTPEDQGLY